MQTDTRAWGTALGRSGLQPFIVAHCCSMIWEVWTIPASNVYERDKVRVSLQPLAGGHHCVSSKLDTSPCIFFLPSPPIYTPALMHTRTHTCTHTCKGLARLSKVSTKRSYVHAGVPRGYPAHIKESLNYRPLCVPPVDQWQGFV